MAHKRLSQMFEIHVLGEMDYLHNKVCAMFTEGKCKADFILSSYFYIISETSLLNTDSTFLLREALALFC